MSKKTALELLNSVKLQNRIIDSMPQMPEELMADYEKERLSMGEVDEWTNASGEFGRTATNPILVNETWGEIAYLSRLVHEEDDQRMIFHRLGSTFDGIDIFELVSENGKFYDVLYVDMYHRHCSKKAPYGYHLLETLDGITGTSEFCAYFPNRLENILSQTALFKFGGSIVSKAIKNFDEKQAAVTVEENRKKANSANKIVSKLTF